MADRRHRNVAWNLAPSNADGSVPSGTVTNALLMDIRDELQTLNRTLSYRFQSHFHNGMDALIRTDKRLAKKITLKRGAK